MSQGELIGYNLGRALRQSTRPTTGNSQRPGDPDGNGGAGRPLVPSTAQARSASASSRSQGRAADQQPYSQKCADLPATSLPILPARSRVGGILRFPGARRRPLGLVVGDVTDRRPAARGGDDPHMLRVRPARDSPGEVLKGKRRVVPDIPPNCSSLPHAILDHESGLLLSRKPPDSSGVGVIQ